MPAGGDKLLVDELACVSFAELQRGRRTVGCGHEPTNRLCRLLGTLGLKGLQAGGQLGLGYFSLGSHVLPNGALFLGLSDLSLRGLQRLRHALVCGPELGQFGAQRIQLGLELRALVLRGLRRNEGVRLEVRFLEGLVNPDAELPGEAQREQRNAMVASVLVVRVVAGFADLVEKGADLAW